MYDIQVSVSLPIDTIGYSTCFVICFSTVFAVVAYSALSLFSVQAFAFNFVFSFCRSFYSNFLTCIIFFQVS